MSKRLKTLFKPWILKVHRTYPKFSKASFYFLRFAMRYISYKLATNLLNSVGLVCVSISSENIMWSERLVAMINWMIHYLSKYYLNSFCHFLDNVHKPLTNRVNISLSRTRLLVSRITGMLPTMSYLLTSKTIESANVTSTFLSS